MNGVARHSAEQALSRLGRVRHCATYDFGRMRDEDCLSVVVPAGEAEADLSWLRDELGPGLVAYVGTCRWLGEERHGDGTEVVVGPGESQFDALRLARTSAPGRGMDTEDLIAGLRRYHERFGIELTQVRGDVVTFRLVTMPPDLKSFARDVDEFCPDAKYLFDPLAVLPDLKALLGEFFLDGGDMMTVGSDEREEAKSLEKLEKGISETGHVYLCWD